MKEFDHLTKKELCHLEKLMGAPEYITKVDGKMIQNKFCFLKGTKILGKERRCEKKNG